MWVSCGQITKYQKSTVTPRIKVLQLFKCDIQIALIKVKKLVIMAVFVVTVEHMNIQNMWVSRGQITKYQKMSVTPWITVLQLFKCDIQNALIKVKIPVIMAVFVVTVAHMNIQNMWVSRG